MMTSMTTATVTEVLETIRTLSPEEKEEVQRGLEAMNDEATVSLTSAQQADVARGLADLSAGRFISEEEFRRTVLHQQ